MKELKTINRFFLRYKRHFFFGILFIILTNYFRILAPQITGYVVNTVVSNIKGASFQKNYNYDSLVVRIIRFFETLDFSEKILYAGIVLLVLAIISGLFMFLMRQTIIVMSRRIEYDQKNQIFAHYQNLDAGFFKSHDTGDLMNRISEDVSRVRMYSGPAMMYFINLAAVIFFSLYFMLRSDVKLTVLALMPLPILAITIYWVNQIIQNKSERIQALLSDLTVNAQESYSGIRVIKSFVKEQSMLQFFTKNANDYKNNALSLAKTEAIYFPSMGLLVGLSTLIVIWVGGMDVINNVPGASVGKITEFVMYIQMLTFPVSAIGWTASMTQRAIASQRRINEFLNTSPEINPGDVVSEQLRGDFIFDNVNFTYPNTGITAIKNLDLHISAGEKIAIVGKTGSGKSTIAQLIMRFYDPQEGSVSADNINLKSYDLNSYRSQISYVPQEVFLFSDSIKNNVLFGSQTATMDDVVEATKLAGVYEDIMQFEKGFDTVLGERGITLSGGQKQRISIARAIIKNCPVIIFDDSLSAVDANTEKEISSRMESFLLGKTSIFITHRIADSLSFDKIIVMENGTIKEMGNHDSLMQANRFYARMYNRQMRTDQYMP